MSFGRFPISYFSSSSTQVSRTNASGSLASSSSEESIRSVLSVSAILISSDSSSSSNVSNTFGHRTHFARYLGTTSDSSDSPELQSSSSEGEVLYRGHRLRQRRDRRIVSTESEVEEIEPSSLSSASDSPPQRSQVPQSAAGVPLPVPLTLEEIGSILCWSRRVSRVIPSDVQLFALIYDKDSAVRFLMEQRVLYDYNRDDMTRADMICDGGERMKFTYNVDRGYIWRCHKYG
ncbi:hypothetical protein BDF20DRAFT_872166, partial [Mycotypha africana]|uniref:uncharacterized protein n=1 Tax=Mycotypha africana TaxID=64632 RepID=UPI002300F53C